MSANRAHKWKKVRAREQKCVPRSTGMGIKKGLCMIHMLEKMPGHRKMCFYQCLEIQQVSWIYKSTLVNSLSICIKPVSILSTASLSRHQQFNKFQWFSKCLLIDAHLFKFNTIYSIHWILLVLHSPRSNVQILYHEKINVVHSSEK